MVVEKTGRTRVDKTEYVLVFERSLLERLGSFQGLSFDVDKYLTNIIEQREYCFMNRTEAEVKQEFKQLIPYVILMHGDEVVTYRRGKLLTEGRLLHNLSIGFGGHISSSDPSLFQDVYESGLERELEEEVEIGTSFDLDAVALINDDENEVGRVHFGIVYLAHLDEPTVVAKEKSINEIKFERIRDLAKKIDSFENWSQICINNIEDLVDRQRKDLGLT